jgi:hypothetical protein
VERQVALPHQHQEQQPLLANRQRLQDKGHQVSQVSQVNKVSKVEADKV